MVMRVTNQLMQRTALQNIFRITEQIFNAQQEISSGKRVNKPSDDPAAMRTSLDLRTSIGQTRQFSRNIQFNRLFLASGDSALDNIGTRLIRAKELAIDQLGSDSTAQTRQFAKQELDKIVSGTLQEANTVVRDQFIFAGSKTRTEPFAVNGTEVIYRGNTEAPSIEIARGFNLPVSLPGSEVLATDLDPVLTPAAALADLNGGAGVPAGSFSITDRAGNSATITVAAGGTVNDVINAINAAGINVSAGLNANRNGLQLTDTSGLLNQALTVAETGTGTTAAALGLLGQRDGNLNGADLNPVVTSSTLLADLNGGRGLTLTDVNIVNGAASAVVTLSSAATVGGVIATLNASGTNVTASVNSQGNGLNLVSNNSSTVAVALEVGNGTSSQNLGIGGGRNVIRTLVTLREALDKNDATAITVSLKNLDASLEAVNNGRSLAGANFRRLDTTGVAHDNDIVNFTKQLSDLQDTDLTQAASDLAQLQIALQATLNTTARIIQPSLLNFLS